MADGHVKSGLVVEGINSAEHLATCLCDTFSTRRGCAMAIANATESTVLSNPRRYVNAGKVISTPLTINPGQTGLIAAEKTFASLYGSEGVVTYEISRAGFEFGKLQMMWYVPLYSARIWQPVVNVCVGSESASQDLYEEMNRGVRGQVVRASETCFEFCLNPELKATAVMGDSGHSTLAVHFNDA